MNYRQQFIDYINATNITSTEKIDTQIQNIGYVKFFNHITQSCLGKPTTTYSKTGHTMAALVYLPDSVKDKVLPDFNVISIDNLYGGILCNNQLKYNYDNYDSFLLALISERKSIKKELSENINNELLNITQMLIKIYLNLVYGMIDNEESILSSKLENPRVQVVATAKKVMLLITSFFLNKSKPVYYIDTDELYVSSITSEEFQELQEFYKSKCSDIINPAYSPLNYDKNNLVGMIKSKKSMMVSDKNRTSITGSMPIIDNDKILLQNKKYFGKQFPDIFPEYTI